MCSTATPTSIAGLKSCSESVSNVALKKATHVDARGERYPLMVFRSIKRWRGLMLNADEGSPADLYYAEHERQANEARRRKRAAKRAGKSLRATSTGVILSHVRTRLPSGVGAGAGPTQPAPAPEVIPF